MFHKEYYDSYMIFGIFFIFFAFFFKLGFLFFHKLLIEVYSSLNFFNFNFIANF